MTTPFDALVAALHDAATYNPGAEAAPEVVLWCDPNEEFAPLIPAMRERLPELLGLADIHLLPQRADAADLVMPSKLTGMLSSGRPVVAGTRADTELGQVVAQCGRLAVPDDAQSFAQAVEELAAQPLLRQELGARARTWAEENLARDAVLGQFEQALRECMAGARRG